MKFAVTADLHLKKGSSSDRYSALNEILHKMQELKINKLVIAGDLFDASEKNYSDFEKVCRSPIGKGVQFHIIPGNHDSDLSQKMFASGNITVYSKTEFVQFDMMSIPILFVPYLAGKSMGEMISSMSGVLEPNKWILVGHGDWIETINQPNPYEPGLYMPLTRGDLETYKPAVVILGHIHKIYDSPFVHYPGSPCPLDINETGKRRFIVVDSETAGSDSVEVMPPVLYFNEVLLILPVENEKEYILNQAEALIKKWAVDKIETNRISIRITVKGYTKDKSLLYGIVKEAFKDYSFYNDEEPDLSKVFLSDDFEKNDIALKVREKIKSTQIKIGETQPSREEIMLNAFHIIYGDK